MNVLRSLEMSGYVQLHITQFYIPEGQFLSRKDLHSNHPLTVKPWKEVPLMTLKVSLLLLTVVFPSNHVWPLLQPKAILTNKIMWLTLPSV
jgi:hypothetical protein